MPHNMKGLEYLIVEPACDVNEKGTREKNDGNENTSMGDNEKIEVHSDGGSFAEEDWCEPDKPMTMETRRGGCKKTSMRYNRYGDDFLIDKVKPEEIGADMVCMGDLVSDKEWLIINDNELFWQEDHSVPEREMNVEQSETEKREHTNLRVLE